MLQTCNVLEVGWLMMMGGCDTFWAWKTKRFLLPPSRPLMIMRNTCSGCFSLIAFLLFSKFLRFSCYKLFWQICKFSIWFSSSFKEWFFFRSWTPKRSIHQSFVLGYTKSQTWRAHNASSSRGRLDCPRNLKDEKLCECIAKRFRSRPAPVCGPVKWKKSRRAKRPTLDLRSLFRLFHRFFCLSTHVSQCISHVSSRHYLFSFPSQNVSPPHYF